MDLLAQVGDSTEDVGFEWGDCWELEGWIYFFVFVLRFFLFLWVTLVPTAVGESKERLRSILIHLVTFWCCNTLKQYCLLHLLCTFGRALLLQLVTVNFLVYLNPDSKSKYSHYEVQQP